MLIEVGGRSYRASLIPDPSNKWVCKDRLDDTSALHILASAETDDEQRRMPPGTPVTSMPHVFHRITACEDDLVRLRDLIAAALRFGFGSIPNAPSKAGISSKGTLLRIFAGDVERMEKTRPGVAAWIAAGVDR